MRVLVSSPGSLGHLGPILWLAEAARDVGHDVRVVVPAETADRVRSRGLDVAAIPPPDDAAVARWRGLVREVEDLMGAGDRQEGDRRFVRGGFGRLYCETGLPTLRQEVQDFRADVVLADAFHSPGVVAAVLADLPVVLSLFGVWEPLSHLLDEVVAGAAPVFEPLGLSNADLLDLWRQASRFSPLPALFDVGTEGRDESRSSRTVRWRRPGVEDRGIGGELQRSLDSDDRRLVYATLGTVAGGIPPMRDRFIAALLPAIAARDVRCVLTVGRDTDLDALPPLPPNVTVAAFLPQRSLLARADLAVSHGGLNTLFDITSARIPHVVIPLHSYDGHVNAQRVDALGVGRAMTGPAVNPTAVGAAIDELTQDDTARAAVDRLADELEALPAVHQVVANLEALCGV